MTEMYVKKRFGIKGAYNPFSIKDNKLDLKEHNFKVLIDERIVEINFKPHEKIFECQWKTKVPDDLFEFFKSNTYKGKETAFEDGELQVDWVLVNGKSCIEETSLKWFNDFYNDIGSIQYGLYQASEKLLKYMKVWLDQSELTGISATGDCLWSIDGIEWKYYPPGVFQYYLTVYHSVKINEENLNELQKCIDNNYEPFIAFDFLHKAINERDPKYKWIYATIAAELAIKEYLIRKASNLESVLIDIPSPPLDKLYGKVLETYGKIKLDVKIGDIQNGVKIRNCLVHRPGSIKIDGDMAERYVHIIETAILQLLYDLYSDMPLASELYPPYTNLKELGQVPKCK